MSAFCIVPTISNAVRRLAFIMETCCVLCEVRTEVLCNLTMQVTVFDLGGSGFDSWPVCVRFMVDEVALGRFVIFSSPSVFLLSIKFHQCCIFVVMFVPLFTRRKTDEVWECWGSRDREILPHILFHVQSAKFPFLHKCKTEYQK